MVPSGVAKKYVNVGSDPNQIPKGIGRPGRYEPKNAAKISLLRGVARRGLQANHQRITIALTEQRTG